MGLQKNLGGTRGPSIFIFNNEKFKNYAVLQNRISFSLANNFVQVTANAFSWISQFTVDRD